MKDHKKKKAPKHGSPHMPVTFEALAELTSSDIIRQVKEGMSRIAPLDAEGKDPGEEQLPSY